MGEGRKEGYRDRDPNTIGEEEKREGLRAGKGSRGKRRGRGPRPVGGKAEVG
jgi:hypothetical protein